MIKAPAKQSQHINTKCRNIIGPAFASSDQTIPTFQHKYRNIVGRNMLHAFGHPVATCCDMLGIENRTSAHARVQHCYTNLAKRLQHHATSTNVAWKIWPISNLSQQHPTCRNRVAKRTQDVSPNNVVTCWVEMLRSFGRGLKALHPSSTNKVRRKTIQVHINGNFTGHNDRGLKLSDVRGNFPRNLFTWMPVVDVFSNSPKGRKSYSIS